MRVGVIGVGAMGAHHARIYSQMKDVELAGISDIDKARAVEAASKYGTTAYLNHSDLLKQKLDAVSIVVPTSRHKEIAIDAIEHGASVLVEKPIAESLESAEAIVSAARKANVKLAIGHIERFNPAVLKLKEIIDSGMLDKVVSISARRVGPYNPRIRDVGVIVDLGVHDIDVISYLYSSKAVEVYAIAGNDIHPFEDHASIMLRFDKNRSGAIDTNWLTPHKVRKLNVIGLGGVAYLDYIEQAVSIHDQEWIRDAKVVKEEPLARELRHFIEVVKNDGEPLVPGEDGIYALKVALTAIESCKKGRVVGIR